MVTGRGCFPVGERGHRWLTESRPAVPSSGTHICVPRGSGIAFHGAGQESVRRVAVFMSTTPDEPESQALQTGTSLNSLSLVRVVMGQSSGWPISLDKIVNPPEGDNVVA